MSYPPQQGYPMPTPPNHPQATTSLVLGIVSLVMCGLFTGIPAMILGRRAKREIQQSGGQLGGESLATAGFVTGLIGTIWTALVTALVLGVFVVGAIVSESFEESCQQFNSDGQYVDC